MTPLVHLVCCVSQSAVPRSTKVEVPCLKWSPQCFHWRSATCARLACRSLFDMKLGNRAIHFAVGHWDYDQGLGGGVLRPLPAFTTTCCTHNLLSAATTACSLLQPRPALCCNDNLVRSQPAPCRSSWLWPRTGRWCAMTTT